MDRTKLSPEEIQAIAHMVRSPGWYVLMRDYILPNLQQATHNLDTPSINESHANIQRGIKKALWTLVERSYKIAELPNPFEKHEQALIATLETYTKAPTRVAEPEITLQVPIQERPRRVSHPV